MLFTMEEFSETELPFKHTAIAENLLLVRSKIALEGMSRDDAQTLQSICPDLFSDKRLQAFTAHPSNTLRQVALERIDFKRVGIIAAAAAAIIFVISKIISWLSSSFGTLGTKGGAIANTDKVNDRVEDAIVSVVPVPSAVEDEEILANAPSRSIAARYLTKDDSIQNNYIRQLISKVEKDNLNKRHAQDAAALYVGAITNVFRLTDNDRKMHLLLGEMLISRKGTIPTVLEEFDWIGGSKKGMSSMHVYNAVAWIERAGIILNTIRQALHYVNQIRKVEKDEVGEFIVEGDLFYAARATYGIRSKIAEAVDARVKDTIAPIFELKDGSVAKMTDTGLTGGKFQLQLSSELRDISERISAKSGVNVGMWINNDYQSRALARPAEHRALLQAVASSKGIDQLGDLYRLSIVDGKVHFDPQLNALKKRLDEVTQAVKLLEGKKTDNSYLTATLKYEGSGPKDPERESVIMDDMMAGLTMAKDIVSGVNTTFSTLGRVTSAARAAVEVMNRAAARQNK